MRRVLLALTAVTFGMTPAVGAATGGGRGFVLHPARGVGPVSLGEAKRQVESKLDQHTSRCQNCLRTYSEPRGNLYVRFAHGRVSGIETFSPQTRLDGVAIGAGPERLRHAHALRRWQRIKNCGGSGVQMYVYGSGPSSSITFGHPHSVDVDVTDGGFGGCGGQ